MRTQRGNYSALLPRGILYYIRVRPLTRATRLSLVLIFLAALPACYSGSRPLRIGSNAPEFTVQDSERSVKLSDFRGQVVVLNFWATWCPPCREEMPSLSRLAQSFDPGTFEVLAVSVDEGGWPAVDKFLAGQKVPFRVALDEGAKMSRAWGTSKYPESYLVDGEGRIRLKFVGPRNWMDPNMATLLEQHGARRKG